MLLLDVYILFSSSRMLAAVDASRQLLRHTLLHGSCRYASMLLHDDYHFTPLHYVMLPFTLCAIYYHEFTIRFATL